MAIIHVRVDERLIHGQVAAMWTGLVGASRIVVVNDEAVKDEMMIAALKIAKPAGVRLSILSRKKAVEKLKSDVYDGERLFIITKNIDDIKYLIENDVQIKAFNIGNIAKRKGAIEIKRSVYMTKLDIEAVEALVQSDISVTARMVPNEPDKSIMEYLKAANREVTT